MEDVNSYRQEVYQLRGQLPIGELAEFYLAYMGLKRELRGPVVAELWKKEHQTFESHSHV